MNFTISENLQTYVEVHKYQTTCKPHLLKLVYAPIYDNKSTGKMTFIKMLVLIISMKCLLFLALKSPF